MSYTPDPNEWQPTTQATTDGRMIYRPLAIDSDTSRMEPVDPTGHRWAVEPDSVEDHFDLMLEREAAVLALLRGDRR